MYLVNADQIFMHILTFSVIEVPLAGAPLRPVCIDDYSASEAVNVLNSVPMLPLALSSAPTDVFSP